MLAILCGVATALGIAGAILNVMKHYSCFIIWEITNVLLIVYNLSIGEYCQATLFLTYGVITGWGLYKWVFEKKA